MMSDTSTAQAQRQQKRDKTIGNINIYLRYDGKLLRKGPISLDLMCNYTSDANHTQKCQRCVTTVLRVFCKYRPQLHFRLACFQVCMCSQFLSTGVRRDAQFPGRCECVFHGGRFAAFFHPLPGSGTLQPEPAEGSRVAVRRLSFKLDQTSLLDHMAG